MAKRQAIDEIEEVEGEEEAGNGSGLETGLILATTLALIVGMVVGLYELGLHYAIGPFRP